MSKLLVTGHSGFVGGTLLREQREQTAPRGWNVATLPDTVDIRDPGLPDLLRDLAPEAVLHLAALTNVQDSFADPDACFDVNFRGTLNLLKSLRIARFSGRLLYVSSGDCYGNVPVTALPVRENMPLRPRNPYAVSKTAAEALCYQWSQTQGLDAVIARPFNHIGPGQDTRFAIPSFCRQIVSIAKGRAPATLRAGDLGVTRDFTDVRDVVRAYFALLSNGRTGEVYNVGSGCESSLSDVVQTLLALAGVEASVETDPARVRPSEQRRMCADISKIHRDTGWRPRIPLRETLEETFRYWEKVDP